MRETFTESKRFLYEYKIYALPTLQLEALAVTEKQIIILSKKGLNKNKLAKIYRKRV